IILPNGFTLASLFFGIFAIVAASRSEFDTAGLYVVFGGLCDALDGRVARATGTGSRFGSELDSLVDAITFGLAAAMIMYFAVLDRRPKGDSPVIDDEEPLLLAANGVVESGSDVARHRHRRRRRRRPPGTGESPRGTPGFPPSGGPTGGGSTT